MTSISALFISRTLDPASPLAKWVKDRGWLLREQSLLRFDALEFSLPDEDYDWIFFYSPRAVTFFCDRQGELTLRTKLAAMGPGTASALHQAGYETAFIGSGDPGKVAKDFLPLARGAKVLFPRARQSRRSIQQLLAAELHASDVVVYDNVAVPPTQPIPAEVVILTSPLNVWAWLAGHSPEDAAKRHFIAIGKSTSAAFSGYGIDAPFPSEPTETGIIELLERTFS